MPLAERSEGCEDSEEEDSERRKMGTGGVPAAAAPDSCGGSGCQGPSRNAALRAVSRPIISVSWRLESESPTACHVNGAEL